MKFLNTLILFSIFIFSIKADNELSCNNTICPDESGFCTKDNICKCYDGYITNNNEDTITQCNYKQKKKVYFLVFELFGFGVGHFYVGHYFIGILKLVLDAGLFSVFCFCVAKNERGKIKEGSINLSIMFIYFFTQALDIGFIMADKYKDGNDIELYDFY